VSELFSLRISGTCPANLSTLALERAERRRVGVAARVDGELEVVVRDRTPAGFGANERAGPCSKP
jgi:hypothetical protein